MDTSPSIATSAPHPGFRRSVAAFVRLGVAVSPSATPSDAGLPDAHPTYRAFAGTVENAEPGLAALLDDASLVDRAAYEMGLFAHLLRAATAAESPVHSTDVGSDTASFMTAPSVRLVRTRWDWDAFVADPALSLPSESGAAWVLHLPRSGPVLMRRLHALPALLLEACAYPLTRAQAVAGVMERVEADPAQLTPLVHAQIEALRAADLLRPSAPSAADHTLHEMRCLLLRDEPPHPARGIAGTLARAARAARNHATTVATAENSAHRVHSMDIAVSRIDHLLEGLRLRGAFSARLDGYWESGDVIHRSRSITPLLDTLCRVMGEGIYALPPYVLT
jgi:hypothetical protein